MGSVGKYISVGIGVTVLGVVIVTVMAPILGDNLLVTSGTGASPLASASTINTLVGLLPLFVGIAALLLVTSLFTGRKD